MPRSFGPSSERANRNKVRQLACRRLNLADYELASLGSQDGLSAKSEEMVGEWFSGARRSPHMQPRAPGPVDRAGPQRTSHDASRRPCWDHPPGLHDPRSRDRTRRADIRGPLRRRCIWRSPGPPAPPSRTGGEPGFAERAAVMSRAAAVLRRRKDEFAALMTPKWARRSPRAARRSRNAPAIAISTPRTPSSSSRRSGRCLDGADAKVVSARWEPCSPSCLELPVLAGLPLRRPDPDGRQHRGPEARQRMCRAARWRSRTCSAKRAFRRRLPHPADPQPRRARDIEDDAVVAVSLTGSVEAGGRTHRPRACSRSAS